MSGRRRRPAVGSTRAEVVSIGSRRPDYSRLARVQITVARQNLGLDHAGFARVLGETLGWDVLPETIEAWEDDVTPPGDVLVWCAVIAQAGHSASPRRS